jgi:hypothetical protein
MPTPPFTSIPVDEWQLREVFNQARIVERAAAGELRMQVDESRPARNTAIRGWVPGTLSQNVLFLDANGNLIAKAHRFLRPDGTLAASGMYDPKRVLHNGRYLILAVPEPR